MNSTSQTKLIMALLAERRKSLGLSQEQLAEQVGFATSAPISRYENGHTIPTLDTFLSLCDACKISPGVILWRAYNLEREK